MCTHAHLNDIDILYLGIIWQKSMVAVPSPTTSWQAHCQCRWVPSPTRSTCESQTTIRLSLVKLFLIIRLCAFQPCSDVSNNQFSGPLDASLWQLSSVQSLWESSGGVCGCAWTSTCANPHPWDYLLCNMKHMVTRDGGTDLMPIACLDYRYHDQAPPITNF